MKYSDGWKYRNEETLCYKLYYGYELKQDHITPWYTITTDNWLIIQVGYCWDGATKFPDFDWIRTPSMIHDALHQAIGAGAISTSLNDQIDRELAMAIQGNPATKGLKRLLYRLRGLYVRKATNLVDQKLEALEIKEVPKLAHEFTFKQYISRIEHANKNTDSAE